MLAWMRLLVILGTISLVGAGCAEDDPVAQVAAGEASAVTGEVDVGLDEGADHDEVVGLDEGADHEVEGVVVKVVMSEFAFEMDDLTVPVGSTVTFDFVNEGAIEHEAMFGDAHEQDEFAELGDHDGDHDDVGGHHGDVQAITLGVGGSGSVTVTFDEPGEMMIGCHLPGHWNAGMGATFVVA